MLVDCEGNKISILAKENRHILILGRSGTGKTYVSYKLISHYADTMPVIILDHSGSYTEDEMRNNSFSKDTSVCIKNPKNATLCCECGETTQEVIENTTDAMITVFGILAKTQREQINIACEAIMEKYHYISLCDLYRYMEYMHDLAEDVDEKKNLSYLLKRMYHLRKLNNFRIVAGNSSLSNGVYVIQVSDFSERIRKDITHLILELMWYRIRMSTDKISVQLILDEFQNLNISDTAIEAMLREGRKFDVGVILLSQYNSRKSDFDIVEQAATALYFRPNDRNLSIISKMIDFHDYRVWRDILQRLNRGECVLSGNYLVNGQAIREMRPIKCQVK